MRVAVYGAMVVLIAAALAVGLRVILGGKRRSGRPTLSARTPPMPSWRPRHRTVDGRTVVLVVLTDGTADLDQQQIAQFSVTDPRYDELFPRAMQAARERAALLDSQSS